MSTTDSPKGPWSPVLETAAAAIGLLAGIVAFVYVLGGIVLLLRLQVRGLRAEVVVATLPREFLVSVGLAVLFQFVFFLAVLLAAFLQQGTLPMSSGNPEPTHPRLARVLRVGIVGVATAILAVPLARWIGWEQSSRWWLIGLVAGVGLGVFLLFWLCGLAFSGNTRLRWGVPIGITAVGCAVVWRLAFVWWPERQWPELLVVLLAGALTTVALWFLLKQKVRSDPRLDRALVLDASLVALIAFLAFIPWRAALEVASLEGQDVAVCTTDTPSKRFAGLFIGANSSSVFVGEAENYFIVDRSGRVIATGLTRKEARVQEDETPGARALHRSPRIVEIPRADVIKRIFLGKGAPAINCASN